MLLFRSICMFVCMFGCYFLGEEGSWLSLLFLFLLILLLACSFLSFMRERLGKSNMSVKGFMSLRIARDFINRFMIIETSLLCPLLQPYAGKPTSTSPPHPSPPTPHQPPPSSASPFLPPPPPPPPRLPPTALLFLGPDTGVFYCRGQVALN